MGKTALETLLIGAGLLLILICCTEEFRQALKRLQATLRQRPRLKYVVYPLGAVLGLGAALLLANALLLFAASRFSYD